MSHNDKRCDRPGFSIPLAAAILLLGATLTSAAAAAPAPKGLTSGEFAMLIAARIHQYDASGAPSTPEAAISTLQKAGVKVRLDVASPLTEEEAVQIFRQFGISLQTQNPDSLMDRDRAASLIRMFGERLSSLGLQPVTGPASRALKSALSNASGDLTPYDCQALRPASPCGGGGQPSCNPCMDCCLRDLGLTGRVCGKLCQKKNRYVCPVEPAP